MSDEPQNGRWVGRAAPRVEDASLVAGEAHYLADEELPRMLHMAVVRSPHAHARILRVDSEQAASAPGVAAVLTSDAVVARSETLRPLGSLPGQKDPEVRALAVERVSYVGQPIAAVAASDRYQAEDAAELVEVEYEPLPAVTDVETALADTGPLLYEEWGTNVQARLVTGSEDADIEAALASADVVLHERLRIQRQAGMPMETRGCLASFDRASGVLTLRITTQKPHLVRTLLARALKLPERQVRIIAPPLGGGFGVKGDLYREDVLASLLAIQTGRPVKWIEDRREHFLGTVHSRDQVHEITIGARRDGTLVAVRDRIVADFGAHLHAVGMGPSGVTARMLPGPYKWAHYQAEMLGVVTNKMPTGSYRGYGNPEANFVMERVVDLVARRLEMDPAEVRRRNLVEPQDLPYQSATGQIFDSGDYPACLSKALQLVDYDTVRAQQATLSESGRFVGVGLACYVEGTGLPGTAPEPATIGSGPPAGYERVVMTMDQSGEVTLLSGLMGMGQGLATALSQIAADELAIDARQVHVVFGDTDTCPYSPNGSSGSRSLVMGGPAVKVAAAKLRERMRRLAAHALEVSVDDLEFHEGSFRPLGAPGRSLTVQQVAAIAYSPSRLPPGEELGLHADGTYLPKARPYAYGAHAAVVEITPETGQIKILKYVVVDDCGVVVNPMIVRGQVHGAVAQGIAGALFEEVPYDADGQLLAASFMDFLIPTAAEIPEMVLGHLEVPSTVVPGGFKGVGEGGVIAPPAALTNAVADALLPLGVVPRETPLSPSRLWAAIQDARARENATPVEAITH